MESKDNKYDLNTTIKCGDKLMDLRNPLIMGILNITPDSFYEGSRTFSIQEVINRATTMVNNGANILDVGGVSTRPNADLLTAEEELKRVIPVVKEVRNQFPQLCISIDTFRAEVAQKAVEAGANIVNDVYGGRYDSKMIDTVAKLNVPFILMHSRGDAQNMQEKCSYDQLVPDICRELSEKLSELRAKGVKDVLIDPGFGFAKTTAQNYELMQQLDVLHVLGCPIVLGVSRKSMIYKLMHSSAEKALNGTTALHALGLSKGANVLRVHDVKEAREVITIIRQMNEM